MLPVCIFSHPAYLRAYSLALVHRTFCFQWRATGADLHISCCFQWRSTLVGKFSSNFLPCFRSVHERLATSVQVGICTCTLNATSCLNPVFSLNSIAPLPFQTSSCDHFAITEVTVCKWLIIQFGHHVGY